MQWGYPQFLFFSFMLILIEFKALGKDFYNGFIVLCCVVYNFLFKLFFDPHIYLVSFILFHICCLYVC